MTQLEKLVPDHIQKHLQRYWESWLMPDLPTDQFYHPQSKELAWRPHWRVTAVAGYELETATEDEHRKFFDATFAWLDPYGKWKTGKENAKLNAFILGLQ
jgi:hypothetical protein